MTAAFGRALAYGLAALARIEVLERKVNGLTASFNDPGGDSGRKVGVAARRAILTGWPSGTP